MLQYRQNLRNKALNLKLKLSAIKQKNHIQFKVNDEVVSGEVLAIQKHQIGLPSFKVITSDKDEKPFFISGVQVILN